VIDGETAADAADGGEGSSSSLYSPLHKLRHQIPATSPANVLHHHQHLLLHPPQQQDYIPRSHERPRHPYWAVESIRQAMSAAAAAAGPGRQSASTHSELYTSPSVQSSDADVATAAAGVVANGNGGEMRDQATNTDVTSECKSEHQFTAFIAISNSYALITTTILLRLDA